jgi:hypothetical protein
MKADARNHIGQFRLPLNIPNMPNKFPITKLPFKLPFRF